MTALKAEETTRGEGRVGQVPSREDGGERGHIECTHQPKERKPTGRQLASRAPQKVDRADGDQPENSRKPNGGDLAKLYGRGLPTGLRLAEPRLAHKASATMVLSVPGAMYPDCS